jgi:hypothetical protein
MTTPEAVLKKAIKDYVEQRGGFWSSVQGGAGSKIGDPDLVICYRGRYIGVEGKTYEGTQSDWQKIRMKQIRAAGGLYILARSVEDVADVFAEIDSEVEDVDSNGKSQ